MPFAEQNDRVFTTERAMIDAEGDAEAQRELDSLREGDRLRRIWDTSDALWSFITHQRYLRDVKNGKIRER